MFALVRYKEVEGQEVPPPPSFIKKMLAPAEKLIMKVAVVSEKQWKTLRRKGFKVYAQVWLHMLPPKPPLPPSLSHTHSAILILFWWSTSR